MDSLLITNKTTAFTAMCFHHPKRKGHQCIKTPTPGVNRFAHNTTTYIYLTDQYHNWIVENFSENYTIKQRLEEGYRMTYLYGDINMLLMFKLTWL